jgi:hypothetical protein
LVLWTAGLDDHRGCGLWKKREDVTGRECGELSECDADASPTLSAETRGGMERAVSFAVAHRGATHGKSSALLRVRKWGKLTRTMVVVSRKGLKGKVWEAFRGRAFHGNVVLNFMRFPQGEFAAYGRSYHEAANRLVTSMGSGHYRDPDACPIVFLYRHAVELYLKAIIHWGNMLLRINSRSIVAHKNIFQEHRLGVLLKRLSLF